MRTSILPFLLFVSMLTFLCVSCKNKTVKFGHIGKQKEIHQLIAGFPEVKSYDLIYNPDGYAIITIYLGTPPDNLDTFQTKPFNNPGQLTAILTLFNSDSTLTFDKDNNEFHYTGKKR